MSLTVVSAEPRSSGRGRTETKRDLVQAAMALWRTNGYAKTTVADICRAAGVSRALFYFYFPAKEDVLFEVGLLSTRAAQKTVARAADSATTTWTPSSPRRCAASSARWRATRAT